MDAAAGGRLAFLNFVEGGRARQWTVGNMFLLRAAIPDGWSAYGFLSVLEAGSEHPSGCWYFAVAAPRAANGTEWQKLWDTICDRLNMRDVLDEVEAQRASGNVTVAAAGTEAAALEKWVTSLRGPCLAYMGRIGDVALCLSDEQSWLGLQESVD